jgi:ribosome-associated heat shock protein Hsp15
MPEAPPTTGSVRVDKWLWAARCFKTRTQAGAACTGGHVQVDGETVKASFKVQPGMLVRAVCPGGLRILEVVALAEKRGPAEVARALYVDHTPPPAPKEVLPPLFTRERGTGRPTKRDRRTMGRVREGDWE